MWQMGDELKDPEVDQLRAGGEKTAAVEGPVAAAALVAVVVAVKSTVLAVKEVISDSGLAVLVDCTLKLNKYPAR